MSAVTAPTAPSALRLVALHAKFNILETVRIPIAVISNLMFPALALVFFVVPSSAIAGDPTVATAAVGQLAMFAVMAAFLFTFGTGVAEDRALPFDGYVRTLPAGATPRLAGRVVTGIIFSVVALVPLIVLGWLLTDATVPAGTLLLGIIAVVAAGLPFLMLGLAIGYRMSSKAAIAVVQVVLFPMAFAGGLFLPPQMFPGWLDSLSEWLPSRAGRDLVVQVLTGEPAGALALPVLVGWLALFTALAVLAFRRDEGRRFR
ncbi:ABC transporter permease [Georgenia sunbinii]|uniref:ABC transporter permease n=1 Tax=Georgenia sunbinii TaxID=3117728 RepID=UPI002F26A415